MKSTRLRQALATLTAAAVLATMTAATVAAPASAAKPKCQGKTATIVGTAKGEIIRGTAKRDIIVAKGGNDRIYAKGGNDIICAGGGNDVVFGGPGADRLWGQLGHDRLLGNSGPDFLAGQVGNDTLNGGIGVDTCFQGTGSGPVLRCERPAPPAPPAPAPPPPPPPTLISLDGILAVAYSDIDGLNGYSTGDVLIARLRDGDGNGIPSNGDMIEMDRYPLDFAASAFGSWGVTSHAVESTSATAEGVTAWSAGIPHSWWEQGILEAYEEGLFEENSSIQDGIQDPNPEVIHVVSGSPSGPGTPVPVATPNRLGDQGFIDVELNYFVVT